MQRWWVLGLALATVCGALALYAIERSDGQSSRAEGPLFGSTVSVRQGESLDDAVARIEGEIGRLPIVRVYSAGAPPSWADVERRAGDSAVVVSFKLAPSDVLSGALDDQLTEWFRAAPDDRAVYWVYYHEPEDNIESGGFTAAEFRAAWSHIAALAADIDNRHLHSALVLMCWSLEKESGRTWTDYIPTERSPDVLAWDCYNRAADDGEYAAPERLFDRSVKISERVGAQWAVAEVGSEIASGDGGQGRARWLESIVQYARSKDAAFVTYFHALQDGDYALTDSASQSAWRRIMSG